MKQILARLRTEPKTLPFQPLGYAGMAVWVLVTAGAFQVAYSFPRCSAFILFYLIGLLQLTEVKSSRRAMNIGWVLGLLVYGPQLAFFWRIFGPGAVTLWLVLAFWLAIFLVTLRQCRIYFGALPSAALAPVLWLAFEFFRGELYYLRFSWLNVGYAFSGTPLVPACFGVYGTGCVLMIFAAAVHLLRPRLKAVCALVTVLLLAFATNLPSVKTAFSRPAVAQVRVAGTQWEFPGENQVFVALEKLRKRYPDIDLFMLSEYTFDGPVPEKIRNWCKKNAKHLVAGGKAYLEDGKQFRNTAFVIGTNGEVVFSQVKAVPIQFFKDGLPATEQKLWDSPWGKLGIATCYDLSYARVIDNLASQGAQAILNPTMDLETWGEHQHKLHSRVTLTRAAEYGLPIFRVASSGISQLIASDGTLLASAPFAVEEAAITGTMTLAPHARVPWDRMVAKICVAVTALILALFAITKTIRWSANRRKKPTTETGDSSPTETTCCGSA